MFIKMSKTGPKTTAENISAFLWNALIRKRRKTAFVELARKKVEPCLKFRPFNGSVRRRQLLLGSQIGNELDYRGAFREQCPIVKHEGGYVS